MYFGKNAVKLMWRVQQMLDINLVEKHDFYYKVRARNGHPWQNQNTVRMEISVGREYQEGKKLEAAMNWATDNFKNVVVLVADTQQRYNFMFYKYDLSEKSAFEIAKIAGDQWISRNSNFLNHHNIKIVRWEDIKNNNEYDKAYQEIVEFYNTSDPFKQDVDYGIKEHWDRQDHSLNDKEKYWKLSTQYALEELAVFSLFYAKEKGISAYPGTLTFTRAMYNNKEQEKAPESFRYALYTSLNFERRKYINKLTDAC